MKEEIDISEAREIWNSPSPQMDKDQIDRAYESIGGYILRPRISKGIKACIGGVAAACLVIAGCIYRQNRKTGNGSRSICS